MPFFSKYHLGIDIGSAFIKACLPQRGNRIITARTETPEGAVSKGIVQETVNISDTISHLVREHKLHKYPAVVTLPSSSLVLRHIKIPMLKPKETTEAVHWEARQVLPFASEDARIDWVCQGTVVNKSETHQDILLVAVKNDIVERYALAIKNAGLRLAAIDIASMALGRWLLSNVSGHSLLVDIGAETTQLHFFKDNRLVFARSCYIGGAQATKSIARLLKIDASEAEIIKLRGDYQKQVLDEWYTGLNRELLPSLAYYRENFLLKDEDLYFERVMLLGGGSLTRGVNELIRDITGREGTLAELTSLRSTRQDKVIYNVALGAGTWVR